MASHLLKDITGTENEGFIDDPPPVPNSNPTTSSILVDKESETRTTALSDPAALDPSDSKDGTPPPDPVRKSSNTRLAKFGKKLSIPNVVINEDGTAESPTRNGVAHDGHTNLEYYLDTHTTRRRTLTPPEHENSDIAISEFFAGSQYQMYVELDELCCLFDTEEWVWLQKSRWVHYQEDVEPEARRWGNPHVPSISFGSLVEFGKLIKQGVMLLDDRASCLSELTAAVSKAWVDKGVLTPEQADLITSALKLPHKHLNAKTGSSFYNAAWTGHRMHGRRDSITGQVLPNLSEYLHGRLRACGPPGSPVLAPESRTLYELHDTHGRSKSIAERCLGQTAEGTAVLTGVLDCLTEPVLAMVRLRYASDLGEIIEADVPLRFAYIVFAPPNQLVALQRVGRSIGTLMANKRFKHVAYNETVCEELLEALDTFLEQSTVVPPGHWDEEHLVPSIMRAQSVTETLSPILEEAAVSLSDPVQVVIPEIMEHMPLITDDPLVRTRRLFGGLRNDVKRRYVKYKSDIVDGLNTKCLAALFFLYFVCLAPAITFGGLLNQKTHRNMGITEALLGISVLGVIFHFLSAQPLMIIGTTGPGLIFEEALFTIANLIGWEYMPFRCWVLFWIFIVTFVAVMFEASVFVKYITRFTEEIFGLLISLIYIYEVFFKLYMIFHTYPMLLNYESWVLTCNRESDLALHNESTFSNETATAKPPGVAVSMISQTMLTILQTFFNSSVRIPPLLDENGTAIAPENSTDGTFTCSKDTNHDPSGPLPNTAMMSFLLIFGTFLIAYFFRIFRTMHFLGKSARRILGDFGVPIAIGVMVIVDVTEPNVHTQKLDIPEGLHVTDEEKRGWFINPLGMKQSLPIAAMFAAIFPALLYFILLFMETQITSMIVNKRLKKGTGFHLDMMLIGAFSILCGLLGLPLVSFATVRALGHVNALCVYNTAVAPGDKPTLLEVKEQRLTGILAHILVGASIAMAPILKAVPIAVLFGVFLYMGITSLFGMQLTDRLTLLLKPVKHHPPETYVTLVRTWKMHVFTLIQVGILIVVWGVKTSMASLAFPFVLLLSIPIRLFLLKYAFTPEELKELDKK